MHQTKNLRKRSSATKGLVVAFFDGMGRLVDLGATGYHPPKKIPVTGFEDDAKALGRDFERVFAEISVPE